ncbi:MAG: hypothetical protein ACREVA_04245 [Burkholderiales bacterium]
MQMKTILILTCMAMSWQVLAQQRIDIGAAEREKPTEQRRAVITETQSVPVYSGTLEQLENDIAMLDSELAGLQKRKEKLLKFKADITAVINR